MNVMENSRKGASIDDIRKMCGFFDPLPPCLHLQLIWGIKFTPHPLLCPLLLDPPPMLTSYLDAP